MSDPEELPYAKPNDTSVDDRGSEAEPFRVMVRVRGGYRTSDYWSHSRSCATQAEAEEWARKIASGHHGAKFLGSWRFVHLLP